VMMLLTPAFGSSPLSPPKFHVNFTTPVKDQMNRGTCWIFAQTALLEQHYRRQGVEMGFLNTSTYVQFSEQASARTHIDCRNSGIDPNFGPSNSTEGGFSERLWYWKSCVQGKVLPDAVCPYIPDPAPSDGTDGVCLGYEAALASSPLRYTVDCEHPFSQE